MKDVNSIWERPITLSDVQPLLTPGMVQSAEKQLGYRLPAAYIELMKKQNGGNIRCGLRDEDYNHTRIFGIGPNENSITNNEFLPSIPHGLIPFDGLAHWCLCLDYRKDPDTPSVVHIELESGIIKSEETIAPTFSEYLEQLIIVEEVEIFVVETTTPIGEVVRIISTVLGTPIRPHFSAGDLHYFGFHGENDVRIYLHGNKVPKYHQEEFLPEHAAERDDLNASILRHPEVDENYVFLEIENEEYEGQRQEMVQNFRDAGLIINSLNHYLS
ncbi:MAG: hypothetical protein H6Q26_3410 [Bacteroidetes bacterium]|uniref:SMI1/KNR4 family protein n=1 Tax=Chitinophaga sp. LS1 TaxID=3051176 RepID=UPI001DC47CAF|nr:SMI1/KNR4 family protein [Chitinophaga sp. LS1]MBP1653253.1 hypothetical protein [Bacteroidota bacterium]WPV64424.1 SMI1/KNR4 family protein [Chitinophaga sp. LS1]